MRARAGDADSFQSQNVERRFSFLPKHGEKRIRAENVTHVTSWVRCDYGIEKPAHVDNIGDFF
jgi:hypothetical protein